MSIAPPPLSAWPAGSASQVRTRVARLVNVLNEPVDISWLVLLRVYFGVIVGISIERFLAYGWVDSLLLKPQFHFKYFGFAWVKILPAAELHALFYGMIGLSVLFALGFAFRWVAPLLALGLLYIQLIDVSTYLNHYYVAFLLLGLLSLSPAHRAFSVDAWLERLRARRAGLPDVFSRREVPRIWLVAIRFQVAWVYVFAALAKMGPDWLLHGQPLGIWLGASTELPGIGGLLRLPGAPLLLSWIGFLYDLSIVGFLLSARTRPWAYLAVLTFHTLTRLFFDIGMFPFIMSGAALVFFPPDGARVFFERAIDWAGSRARWFGSAVRGTASPTTGPTWGARREALPVTARLRYGLLAFAVFAVVQLLVPLRHLAYGGNVLWHEQGMRFSMRVMLRAKGGTTSYRVVRRETGETYEVRPSLYLTRFQENEMNGQPDLILKLAHHIRRDFEARGLGPVAVYADSWASLNGRRLSPLVSPEVDLTGVQDGFAPANWVSAAPSGPPPRVRPVL